MGFFTAHFVELYLVTMSGCRSYHDTMLQKFSNCEVKAARCGNFTIFPPLKFYVKSNFGEFKRQKMSLLALLEVLNLDFSKFEPFLKSLIYQNSKLRVSEIVKIAIFHIKLLPKLIPRKVESQINSCIEDLNFTFLKFLEHSA